MQQASTCDERLGRQFVKWQFLQYSGVRSQESPVRLCDVSSPTARLTRSAALAYAALRTVDQTKTVDE